ncbi:hypothetical protein GCM10009771_23470 [Nesterenkonia flava]
MPERGVDELRRAELDCLEELRFDVVAGFFFFLVLIALQAYPPLEGRRSNEAAGSAADVGEEKDEHHEPDPQCQGDGYGAVGG